jgi:hypothetical protein
MVTGPEFLKGRVRGGRVRAQQLGEPSVGRSRRRCGVGLGTGARPITISAAVGPSHPAASSSHPCDPHEELTYRRVRRLIVMEVGPRGKGFCG